MREISYPLSGSCQCGGVTYTLNEPPLMIVACHCRECQKLSTSAFSITAMVKPEAVVFSGEMSDWSRSSDSGNISAAKFCPTCGNRIYHYNPDDSSTLKLKPSNISDTRVINPTLHVWISEKQDWYQIPEGVKTFQKQPS
ncbi:GFA family protein [Saccharophagus degradans]|uniref:GFA family protein n=1 Tax=Saccharophagus degradans TaxID=86304 RepID=A0AAW7X9X3_9GAMM|nr:GFA family protein [Saccharophagus degradans]MDO6424458.1 GFA family protein [Saccharophagus degradans]MDO6608919.1 GFA family protein [Saccharophagus degradans]